MLKFVYDISSSFNCLLIFSVQIYQGANLPIVPRVPQNSHKDPIPAADYGDTCCSKKQFYGIDPNRSRTTYPDYHNYNEGRSSSVPPSLLQQQQHQHQPNGQTRIGSPIAFRGRPPPPPNVRGPWPPRSLSPRYYRPPPGSTY